MATAKAPPPLPIHTLPPYYFHSFYPSPSINNSSLHVLIHPILPSKRRLNNSRKLGRYTLTLWLLGNKRELPLTPRSCRETGSNWHPVGHEPSTASTSHPPTYPSILQLAFLSSRTLNFTHIHFLHKLFTHLSPQMTKPFFSPYSTASITPAIPSYHTTHTP